MKNTVFKTALSEVDDFMMMLLLSCHRARHFDQILIGINRT
ncbi:hypothetical protein [Alcanivorax hongdengensis]|nr:hypothetical protein [Alcanivorax hongdengensis]